MAYFGNGLTHTILGSTGSEFFSLPVFHEAIQVRNGIESGYYSASQPGNFISTFTASQVGNVYAKGNITCEGILTAPNIYTKAAVEGLLSDKQQTLIFKDPTQLSPPVQGFPLLGGGNIIIGIAVVPPLTLTYYGNDYIEFRLAVDLNQKANTATTYTKTEVDGWLVPKASTTYVNNALAAKQNTLTFVDPMNLGTLVAGYPLLIGSNIIPGLFVELPLTLTKNSNNYLTIGLSTNILVTSVTATGAITGGSISTSGGVSAASVVATGGISSNTMTTNTLTTAGAALNITSDLVLFKANDNTIYLEADANGVLCSKDFTLNE